MPLVALVTAISITSSSSSSSRMTEDEGLWPMTIVELMESVLSGRVPMGWIPRDPTACPELLYEWRVSLDEDAGETESVENEMVLRLSE